MVLPIQSTHVSHYFAPDDDDLTRIARRYNRQVTVGSIRPTWMDLMDPGDMSESTGLIVAQDQNDRFQGVMAYSLVPADDLARMVGARLYGGNGNGHVDLSAAQGFRTFGGEETLVVLDAVEIMWGGVEAKLLEKLQADIQSDGVFVEDQHGKKQMYVQNGFRESGLHGMDPAYPVMIWTPSGNY